tara:strand:+ start:11223 stop:11933 length:711 start_codon:yes stop_codon:yes gene_type:complete
VKNKVDSNTLKTPLAADILSIIRDRRSVRAFLNKPVSDEIITRIIDCAKWAPSGVNTQPWHIDVLGPKSQKLISNQIIHAREIQQAENPDYQYYPSEWPEPYKTRRKACGSALYGALNISYSDTEKRKAQWYKNYSFFGAPIGLIFYIDKNLCKGSWMDMGMFIQNVMLAARGCGLETCAQASLSEYPDIIRSTLSIKPKFHIVCGMALGYADWSDPVNQYRTERESSDIFNQWHE